MAWVKCGIRVLGILDRNNNQLLVLKSILPGELVPLFSYVNLPLPVPLPSRPGSCPSTFMPSRSAVSDCV